MTGMLFAKAPSYLFVKYWKQKKIVSHRNGVTCLFGDKLELFWLYKNSPQSL